MLRVSTANGSDNYTLTRNHTMTTKKPFTEPKLQEELSLAAGTLQTNLVSGSQDNPPFEID